MFGEVHVEGLHDVLLRRKNLYGSQDCGNLKESAAGHDGCQGYWSWQILPVVTDSLFEHGGESFERLGGRRGERLEILGVERGLRRCLVRGLVKQLRK